MTTTRMTSSRKLSISLIAFSFLVLLMLVFARQALSKHHPGQAQVLIVEGWLPAYAVEAIAEQLHPENYEKIIITGMAFPESIPIHRIPGAASSKTIFLPIGGVLMNAAAIKTIFQLDKLHTLTIFAHGSEAAGKYAHYSVFINDSLIGGSYACSGKSAPVVYPLAIDARKIKTIFIYFDNDKKINDEDRNLWIDSVCLDKKTFAGNKDFHKVGEKDIHTHYLGFRSESLRSATLLKTLGVNNEIIILDTLYTGRNRTRAYAVNCRKWMTKHYRNQNIPVNIVSIDYHSRRTYNTYKSLGFNHPGIYSMPYITEKNSDDDSDSRITAIYIFKEYISLLLNYFY